MITFGHRRSWQLAAALLVGAVWLAGPSAGLRAASPDPVKTRSKASLKKEAPENVDDLRAIQKQVKTVLKKVLPATVGVRVGGPQGGAQGSGVIVSKDGYVLTAAHVSGPAGRKVVVILPDGRKVKGKTLGANRGIDSGMIKITDEGPWPFAEMGDSSKLKKGQWCIATGHPGGFQEGRTPVVRLGRILNVRSVFIQTDCKLVGGDSGGPVFDMDGKVIGIHSSIGGRITANIHVPVNTYRDNWDRMVKGDVWGSRFGERFANQPWLGVEGDQEADSCKIARVLPNSPAAKGGLKSDDVILTFDGQKIENFSSLASRVSKKKPGDKVTLEVQRGKEKVTVQVVIGKRGDQ
jgi:serine protease Do